MFLKTFFNFLFPAKCLGCRADGVFICQKCLAQIPPAESPDEEFIVSVWSYKNPIIKKLLWMLKFENRFAVAEDLGQNLHDHLKDELAERAIFDNLSQPILVPIPLSRKSLRKRGYNQSEILAREISKRSSGNFRVENVLRKISETPTQHSIKNKTERLKNLRGTFRVANPDSVAQKCIVLVDDITTTHGTMLEAKRALRRAGSRKVLGFTVAH